MKIEIKIPAMGESISEATIGTILKPSGSNVKAEDEILELETEKVNQVLYAPKNGVLELKVSSGQTVKIGDIVGTVDTEGKTEEVIKEKPEKVKTKEEKPKKSSPRITKEKFLEDLASPQKMEEQKPEPKITEKPAVQSQKEKQRETRRKMTKIRQVIARRLVEAQHNTAMLTTFNEVDMSQVMAMREKYKDAFAKRYNAKLGFMAFFVKATVSALMQFPELNSYIDGDDIVHREYYDVGIAVATDRGLLVPVVRGCDQLSFSQIEQAIESFAKKAREGTLALDDLQGGGFTITNGGVYGSLLSTPILNPPQSGILGMHKIEKRPIVVDDQIVIRPMMYLALSYDHRIVDGKEAVSFLVTIKNLLEDPSRLLLNL